MEREEAKANKIWKIPFTPVVNSLPFTPMFPEFDTHHKKRIRNYHRRLGTRLFSETLPLVCEVARHDHRVPFERLGELTFGAIVEGDAWGSGTARAWFHVCGSVPESWQPGEATLWMDTGTEALVRNADGEILHGLVGGGVFDDTAWKMARPLLDLGRVARPGASFEIWIEAACMTHPGEERMDQPIPGGFFDTGFPEGILHRCRMGRYDPTVWNLYFDMEVLIDLMESLPTDSVRGARVFRALRLACDSLGREPGDLKAAHKSLRPALAARADASAPTVFAVGHGHLDTAWLWPLATSREKVVRTFANQLDLIDRYPGYIFGASAALHYHWIREDEPTLFERVREAVRAGRWEVQGAMWVESDTNLPSGESLIRQMLFGRAFFRDAFAEEPDILWLPDVFGYSAALPQIMRACGVRSLLTQKISWSQFHRFPHTTFRWEGIDGSEVLVHFPPEDNYNSGLTPGELRKAQARFAEKDRLDSMLSLFGYGDGGGGPHPMHIERGCRQADLEGLPKVRFAKAQEFFNELREQAGLLEVWRGELYLELHRKTLTSQAFIKRANRRMEERLAALEMLFSACGPDGYPVEELRTLWETLLLNQFHDIIPGSSVHEVYREARRQFEEAARSCTALESQWAERCLTATDGAFVLFNPLSCPYQGLVALPEDARGGVLVGQDGTAIPVQDDGETAWIRVAIPAHGFREFRVDADRTSFEGAAGQTDGTDELVLENALVRYEFDPTGTLVSARLRENDREFLPPGGAGNQLRLYQDNPAQWEAWDLDIHYLDELIETAACRKISKRCGPVFQELELEFEVGDSTLRQRVRLCEDSARLDFRTEVDWREDRKMLRVAFETGLRASEAAYDIQFGYVKRPAHANTSRDAAMFEVCGHRYADLSEVEAGFALLNDGKYGYRTVDGEISLSLLCAPRFPDPEADRGQHTFTYAILPHTGAHPKPEILAEAARLNQPPLRFDDHSLTKTTPQIPFRLEGDGVEVAAFKQAEDGHGQILRLVERRGIQIEASLDFNRPLCLQEVNAMEEPIGTAFQNSIQELTVRLNPFQIRSYRLTV